jgi:hypothetical protein
VCKSCNAPISNTTLFSTPLKCMLTMCSTRCDQCQKRSINVLTEAVWTICLVLCHFQTLHYLLQHHQTCFHPLFNHPLTNFKIKLGIACSWGGSLRYIHVGLMTCMHVYLDWSMWCSCWAWWVTVVELLFLVRIELERE